MATVNQRLAFIISANPEQAIKAFEKTANAAERQMGKTEKTLGKVGAGLTKFGAAGLAASGVIGSQLFKAGQAAGDLSESLNKTRVIFGQTSGQIEVFAETAATSLGLSQRAALDAASTFATFGKAAGLAGNELGTFSKDLVTLSADLASFYNTSPEDAVLAIGAALRGESEPIRRYGVLLNDATLKQEALTMGIYDGKGALTAQQRVLAAQAQILKQTSDAQGDFARTSDGLANSQRILTANIENAKAQLGEAFVPVINTAVSAVGSAVGAFNNFEKATGGMGSQLATVGTVGLGTISTMSLLTGQAIKMRDRFFNINKETGKLAGGLTSMGKVAFGVTGVISAAALVYGVYNSQKKVAEQRTKDLAEALKLEGREQTSAIASLVENDKATGNFIDSLSLLGLNLQDVNSELAGHSVKFDAVRDALFKFTAQIGLGQVAADQFAEAIGYQGELTQAQVYRIRDMVAEIDRMVAAQEKAEAAQRKVAGALGNTTGKTKAQIEAEEMSTKKTEDNTDKTNKNASAQETLKQKVEKAADAFKDKMAKALDAANEAAKKAKDEFDSYAKGIASSIMDTVGLSTAYDKLLGNQQAVTDATAELGGASKQVAEAQKQVAEAEATLAKVRSDPKADADDLARANSNLADEKQRLAEATNEELAAQKKLAQAQKAPLTFLSSLQAQQQTAQEFSTNLQKLIDLGLNQTAIDQITALGADAGNAVANEILLSANPAQYAAQINGIITGMQQIADKVGLGAAAKFKQAGVDSANALVTGIQDTISQYELKLNWKNLSKSKKPIKTIADLQKAFAEQMSAKFSFAGVDAPELAEGGIVKATPGGTLIRAGEGGRDEAVVPLPAKMGGDTINITVQTGVGDPAAIGQAIVDVLQKYQTRVGRLPLKVG